MNIYLAKRNSYCLLICLQRSVVNYDAMKFLSLAKSFFDSEVKTLLNALQKNFTIADNCKAGCGVEFFMILDLGRKAKKLLNPYQEWFFVIFEVVFSEGYPQNKQFL